MANRQLVMVLRADSDQAVADHDQVAMVMESAFRDVWEKRGWEIVTEQDEIDSLYEAEAQRRAEQEAAEERANEPAAGAPNAEASVTGEQAGQSAPASTPTRQELLLPPAGKPANPGGSTPPGN